MTNTTTTTIALTIISTNDLLQDDVEHAVGREREDDEHHATSAHDCITSLVSHG